MKIVKKVGEKLPTWLGAEIRPVLAFTGAGRALAVGSLVLARRGWDALGTHLGGWERAGVLGFSSYVAVHSCQQTPHVAEFAVPAAAAAWCVAAWWAAPPVAPKPSPLAEEPDEPEPAAEPEDVYTATVEWIRQQTGDRQGVHLRDLLQHAQEHGMFEGLDVSGLRTHLERWKIPVRDRVRVRGLGVTVGVHRDDLPPLPDREPQDEPNPGLHGT